MTLDIVSFPKSSRMIRVDALADQSSDCSAVCKAPMAQLGDQKWHMKPPHLCSLRCQKDLTVPNEARRTTVCHVILVLFRKVVRTSSTVDAQEG